MPKYLTNWIDYRLPTGQDFVALWICRKIRICTSVTILSGTFAQHVYVADDRVKPITAWLWIVP
jgi:hypothetical protein